MKRTCVFFSALILGCLGASALPRAARAATRTVCASGCDFTTIKNALAAATTVAGDVIQLGAQPAAQPWIENQITVNKNVTIAGAGAAQTIIQAAATFPSSGQTVFTVQVGATATLQDVTVRYSNISGSAGIINSGTLTLLGVIVERMFDSGIVNQAGATLIVRRSTIRNAGVSAISSAGTLTVEDSTLSGAQFGFTLGGSGTTTINRTAITANSSSGINISGAAARVFVFNTTIAGNGSAATQGGGIYNIGSIHLDHCTVSGNFASVNGGGIYSVTSEHETWSRNTIIAGNTVAGAPSDCFGGIDSYGYTLLGSTSLCGVAVFGTGDQLNADPRLDFLRMNGGPTATLALLPDSPAIDGGSCVASDGTTVTTDQRGTARPQGSACDIGAYEFNGGAPPQTRFACWDRNQDGACQVATEDTNGDGDCTPADCRGTDGTNGLDCWDLNGDRTCNLATEDLNRDGACNLVDCRGSAGPRGAACWDVNGNQACDAGEDINRDGNCNVLDCQGTNGLHCWDLNQNYICDPNENVNGDGDCTVADCRGATGATGAAGVACWDSNGNGACNLTTEDLNRDGACSVLDCRGADGTAGLSCWDTNANHICDGNEDKNGDGCNVLDCQGAAGFSCWDFNRNYRCDAAEDGNGDGDCTPADCRGPAGPAGPMGAACWDSNGNGVCDKAAEDANGDGACTLLDCRGTDGTNGNACWDLNINHTCDPSEDANRDGGCTVLDCRGQDGFSCWDVDQDYVCDPAEDKNADGTCTVADCRGPIGPAGPMGAACWDSNGNGQCDPAGEDLDGDGTCTLTDCRGAAGTSGYSCWDLNTNSVCDPSEDSNGDKVCNVLDCRGKDGTNGKDGISCWDANANGACDPAEDRDDDGSCTAADCAGKDGVSALTRLSDEPPGAHCAHGGVKIETGIDDNSDQTLSDDEVDQTMYACNGADGATPTVTVQDKRGCGCGVGDGAGAGVPAGGPLLLAAGAWIAELRRRRRRHRRDAAVKDSNQSRNKAP